ncbi:MAG: IPTL-CTERM sorting domain-containing protein [Acidobacteria bacterium]|nr:IPTL-CTERM sorting domain-containing protein [Acidobacteriota bacterium]
MKRTCFNLVASVVFAALLYGPSPALAQTAPSLGSATSFAVLGASTVTNTGSSIITGDLGLSPGTSVTGFPPGTVVSGGIHAADSTAAAAQTSLTTAYNDLASQACTQTLTGQDLGGMTLTAGVYCFSTSAQLTGILTLNAQGNANAVFIFKIGSTLTTASGSSVVMSNSGSTCNVYWQVGSSATLGTTTTFAGNILAQVSITLNTGATVKGRILARTGAVTVDANTVNTTCDTAAPPVCPVITLLPATLPNGTVGVAYSQTITGSGGTAPYTFSVTAGTLPAGLTLTSAGVLAGTPTTAGTSTVTIRGTDANGCVATLAYTMLIATQPGCPVITLLPATLPNGALGVAYNQTITGSGGTAPYTFKITSGALPAGLILTSNGVLAGTPTSVGTSSSVTIRGTDANGCFAELAYTIIIPCPVITLAPATLPNGTVGVAYSQTITGSGGTAPYTFTVNSGALPAGLTLTAAGVLAGTPTTAGTPAVTIRGTDANGCFKDTSYTMNIISPVPTLPQWGALLLAAGLLGLGYLRLRRRARAE